MRARRSAVVLLATVLTAVAPGVGSAVASAPAATPKLDLFDAFVVEGAGPATLSLRLSAEPTTTVRVTVSTSDGTAVAGSDYEATSKVVEFPPGDTSRTFAVPILDDPVVEPQESFAVSLSDPDGVTIGVGTSIVAIVDNENAPGVRDCSDDNPYTDDVFDEDLGYCTHAFTADRDLDDDDVSAAAVGGPDCDDSNSSIKPGAVDVAGNGVDEDCDGLVDGEGSRDCDDANPYTEDSYSSRQDYCRHTVQVGADLDGDEWVAAEVEGPDCDDTDASVHPDATQLDNGADNDCDGLVDFPGPTGPDTVTPVDIGPPVDCPEGEECTSYVLTCSGTPLIRVVVARAAAVGAARGVAVLFSGGDGDTFFAAGFTEGAETVEDLQAAGLEVLRVSWLDTWIALTAPPYGMDVAACRAATITDYLHTEVFVPLDLPATEGVCGFCVGGNSGGATQAAYLLSHYHQDDILDAAVITSGPVQAALSEGCLNTAPEFDVSKSIRSSADYAYGYFDGETGPCVQRDRSWQDVWDADSILHGGSDYQHPNTRVELMIGGLDDGSAPGNAAAYAAKLIDSGSRHVRQQDFPGAGHGLTEFLTDPTARAAFVEAFVVLAPWPQPCNVCGGVGQPVR